MNIGLLCKWWWKIENGSGIWQEIARKKYLKHINMKSKIEVWRLKMVNIQASGMINGVGKCHLRTNFLTFFRQVMNKIVLYTL